MCAPRACQPKYHYAGRASPAPRIDQVGAGELSAHLRRTALSRNCHSARLNLSTPPPGAPPRPSRRSPAYQITELAAHSGALDEITTARGAPRSASLRHLALRHEIRALSVNSFASMRQRVKRRDVNITTVYLEITASAVHLQCKPLGFHLSGNLVRYLE